MADNIPTQLLELRFGATEQKLGARHIQPGQLVTAENVYQSKTKTYRKRNATAALTKAADVNESGVAGGDLAAGTALGVGSGTLVMTGARNAYSRDTASWNHRGPVDRVGVSSEMVMPSAGNAVTTALDTTNNHLWIFGSGAGIVIGGGVGVSGTWFSVKDLTTGETLIAPSPIPLSVSTYLGGARQLRAFYDAANLTVWLFFYNGTTVVSYPLVVANAYAYESVTAWPAPTNVFVPAAGTLWGFDLAMTATSAVLIAYGTGLQFGGGANNTVYLGLFDKATGAIAAVPGIVPCNPSGAYRPSWFATIAKQDTTTAVWFIVATSNGGNLVWCGARVNAGTLATVNVQAFTGTGAVANSMLSGTCWIEGNTLGALFPIREATSTEVADLMLIFTDLVGAVTFFTYPPMAAYAAWRRGWAASDPFKLGSYWYALVGYADGYNLQHSYFLVRLIPSSNESTIVARALYGRGGQFQHNPAAAGSYLTYTQGAAFPWLSGNKVRLVLQEWLTGSTYGASLVEFDLAATIGNLTTDNNDVVMPSAWPQMYSGGHVYDLTPAEYPRAVTLANIPGALPAGTYSACCCYAYYAPDGSVRRSAPSAISTIAMGGANGFSITVDSARAVNPYLRPAVAGRAGARIEVEFYASVAGSTLLRRVSSMPNPDRFGVGAATTLSFYVTAAPAATDEAIYTTGGAPSNWAAPPFRQSFVWRDRLFLVDTDVKGEVWPSQIGQTGFGRDFSPLLAFRVASGSGRVIAGAPLDSSYAVLFRESGISVISGPGPDAFGMNGYEPQALPYDDGISSPASVVSTPVGVFYQGKDGGIWCIRPGLAREYVGRGVDDYKSTSVTAAVNLPKDKHVRFHLSDGKILVYDYGNPTEESQGQWYVWTGENAAVAACSFGDVHHYLTSGGTVYKEASGTYASLAKIKFAKVRLGGLQGRAKVARMQMIGDYKGAHGIQFTATYNDAAVTQTFTKSMSSGPEEFELKPSVGDYVTNVDLQVEETGAGTTEGFTCDGVAVEYSVVPGLRNIPTRRL